jgi:hypothetical protein
MKLTNWLVMFFSIFCSYVNAQTIEISSLKLNLPELDFYIEDVIVAQKEKEVLGFFYPSRTKIRFRQPFETEFKNYFSKHTPIDETKVPITIRINNIFMSSQENASDTELSISFLKVKDSTFIELAKISVSDFYRWRGLNREPNANKKLGRNLLNVFEKSFILFINQNFTNIQKELPIEFISNFVIDSTTYPILTYPNPQKGVFRSFDDFINNNIDISENRNIPDPEEANNDKLKVLKRINVSDDVWAISNGTNYYLKNNNSYYPIIPKQENNTYNVFIPSSDLSSNADVGGTVLGIYGGFLGGMIGYGLIRLVEVTTSKLVELEIDMKNGGVIPKSEEHQIEFTYHSKNKKEKVFLYYEGKEIGSLEHNQNFIYKYNQKDGIVRILFKTESGKSKEVCVNPVFEKTIRVMNKGDRVEFNYIY